MQFSRRNFLRALPAAAGSLGFADEAPPSPKAQITITLDLEMSRHYPSRDQMEWDYQKGNLDAATKDYALRAGEIAREAGGLIHYFCVGRVLEQDNIEWLKKLSEAGHPIGNHTYDHVNVLAKTPEETQFRFRRSPWLVRGKSASEIIEENIRLTTLALKERANIANQGFRTPGGFPQGLKDREDVRALLRSLEFSWVSSLYPSVDIGPVGVKPDQSTIVRILKSLEIAQPFRYPEGLIEIPMSPVSDVHGFRTNRWKLDWFLEVLEKCLDWTIANQKVFDFLSHPSCLVVEDPKFEILKLILAKSRQVAEIVDLETISRRVGL